MLLFGVIFNSVIAMRFSGVEILDRSLFDLDDIEHSLMFPVAFACCMYADHIALSLSVDMPIIIKITFCWLDVLCVCFPSHGCSMYTFSCWIHVLWLSGCRSPDGKVHISFMAPQACRFYVLLRIINGSFGFVLFLAFMKSVSNVCPF